MKLKMALLEMKLKIVVLEEEEEAIGKSELQGHDPTRIAGGIVHFCTTVDAAAYDDSVMAWQYTQYYYRADSYCRLNMRQARARLR